MGSRFTDRQRPGHPRTALDGRAGVLGCRLLQRQEHAEGRTSTLLSTTPRKSSACSTCSSPLPFTPGSSRSCFSSGCSVPPGLSRSTASIACVAGKRSNRVRHQWRAKTAHAESTLPARGRDITCPHVIMCAMTHSCLPSRPSATIVADMKVSCVPDSVRPCMRERSLGSLAGVAACVEALLRVGPAAPCSPALGLAPCRRPLRALAVRFQSRSRLGAGCSVISTIVSLL